MLGGAWPESVIHCEDYMDDREGWDTWKKWKNEWKQAKQQQMKEKQSEKGKNPFKRK